MSEGEAHPEASRRLAIDLLHDAINNLRQSPPPKDAPESHKRLKRWRLRWRDWFLAKSRAVRWFRNPRRSAVWIEMSGLSWKPVVEELESRGLLEEPTEKDMPPGYRR